MLNVQNNQSVVSKSKLQKIVNELQCFKEDLDKSTKKAESIWSIERWWDIKFPSFFTLLKVDDLKDEIWKYRKLYKEIAVIFNSNESSDIAKVCALRKKIQKLGDNEIKQAEEIAKTTWSKSIKNLNLSFIKRIKATEDALYNNRDIVDGLLDDGLVAQNHEVELEGKVSQLNNDNSTLTQENTNLKTEKKDLETINKDLETAFKKVNKVNSRIIKEFISIKEQLKRKELFTDGKIAAAEQEAKQATAECQTLKGEMQEMKSIVSQFMASGISAIDQNHVSSSDHCSSPLASLSGSNAEVIDVQNQRCH